MTTYRHATDTPHYCCKIKTEQKKRSVNLLVAKKEEVRIQIYSEPKYSCSNHASFAMNIFIYNVIPLFALS
jgi:hypothetical protein